MIESMANEDVNVVGAGAIAGGGYNGEDDVKVGKSAAKKYKESRKGKKAGRKVLTFNDLVAYNKANY